MLRRSSDPWLRLAGLVLAIDALPLLLTAGGITMLQLFSIPSRPSVEGWLLVIVLVAAAVAAFAAGLRALRGRLSARVPGLAVTVLMAIGGVLLALESQASTEQRLFGVGIVVAHVVVALVLLWPASATEARSPAVSGPDGA